MPRLSIFRSLIVIAVLAAAVLHPRSAPGAEFFGIGFLDANDDASQASFLSADGSTVAGTGYRELAGGVSRRAFIWSPDRGIRPLDPEANSNELRYDRIYDVSPFGESVLSNRVSSSAALEGHFQWTESDGNLPIQPGLELYAFGGDRNIYAGSQSVISFWGAAVAIRHTPSGGIEELGWLPWGDGLIDDFHGPSSHATGISASGDVVVGNSVTTASTFAVEDDLVLPGYLHSGSLSTEAFRWTEEEGMIALGELPGGGFGSSAIAISGDGRTIIGESEGTKGLAGFRWTPEEGMVEIGGLLPIAPSKVAAVSFDGSRIVGNSIASIEKVPGHYGEEREIGHWAAMLWDEEHGVRKLSDVLEQEYDLDLGGWQLIEATDISHDGLTIIGNGLNPLGQQVGWVVRLNHAPEPTSAFLLASSTLAFAGWRRRRRGAR